MRISLPLLCLLGFLLMAGYVMHTQDRSVKTKPVNGKAGAVQTVNNETDRELWAGISSNQPVFRGSPTNLNITFTLVNDGQAAVDPKIDTAKLVVNGEELSVFQFMDGPRDDRWNSLPPGDYILFARGSGEMFKQPGIYRLSWKGEGFQSPEIVVRVLPEIK